MKRRLLSLFLFVFAFLICFSQENAKPGLLYLDDLQYHRARNFFLDQVKASPADVKNFCLLGDAYLGLQLPDSAKLMYQKAASIDPKSAFPLIGLGKIALLNGDIKSQLDFFEKAKKMDRKNPEVYNEIAKGCIGLAKKDTATGDSYLTLGFELNSKYPAFHITFGDYESLCKRFGEAANAYERAIFFDPSSTVAYRKLGLIQRHARFNRDAINSFNKCIELNSDQSLVYKNLGDLYYSIGRYPEAEKNYKIYISKGEITSEDKERYAIILFFNKKYTEASGLLESVMDHNTNESVLLRIRGYIACETGDLAKGLEYMNKFFKLHDPSHIIATDYLYYGRLLQKSGNDSLAIDNYNKALVMDSTKSEIYEDLAKLYTTNQKHIEAAACYKKMIPNGSDKVNTWFQIGKEYYFEGDMYRTKYDSLMALQRENKIPFTDSISVYEAKRLYFQKADSAFTMVTVLNPQYSGGFMWKGRMNSLLDPEALTNYAKESYEKASAILEAGDAGKNSRLIIECYKYLGSYYFLKSERLVKTDKKQSKALVDTSIDYFRKILKLDPNDAQALEVFKRLKIALPVSN
jgi:tetratricopeptide (TPR) repeat protein